MSSIKNQLIAYSNAISPAAFTKYSVPMMLTPASATNPKLFYEKPSILTVAKKAGYKTIWISNQGSIDSWDVPATLIANEANYKRFINSDVDTMSMDHAMLPMLDSIINEDTRRKLIVLHTMGSHPLYRRRYKPDYGKFSNKHYSIDGLSDDKKQIQAEYDNSILYADAFIAKLIEIIRKTNKSAWLLYASDHGLKMFEDGKTHGHGISQNSLRVPFIFWMQKWEGATAIVKAAETNRDKFLILKIYIFQC